MQSLPVAIREIRLCQKGQPKRKERSLSALFIASSSKEKFRSEWRLYYIDASLTSKSFNVSAFVFSCYTIGYNLYRFFSSWLKRQLTLRMHFFSSFAKQWRFCYYTLGQNKRFVQKFNVQNIIFS